MAKLGTKISEIKVSKKLSVAFLVFTIHIVRGFGFELPPESYDVIMNIAMTYLAGQSFIDAVIAYKVK
jgi:hypothetical protein